MTDNKKPYLRVSSEFRRLCLPITPNEYAELERDIIHQENPVEIKVWGNIILFDFEKYELCKKHDIPYKAARLYARNTGEALLWLCKRQLENKDLPLDMQRYLIGKRYLYEKMLGAHNITAFRTPDSKRGIPQKTEARFEDTAYRTQERLGKEYNIAPLTVRKYSVFAEALDTIYDVSQDLAVEIMRGEIKISQENIEKISKTSEQEIMSMAEYILENRDDFLTFTSSRRNMERFIPVEAEKSSNATFYIKDMPKYDPDSEAASLTLTIPSWISSINRVRNAGNIDMISVQAKKRLFNELEKLSETIFYMLEMLREE